MYAIAKRVFLCLCYTKRKKKVKKMIKIIYHLILNFGEQFLNTISNSDIYGNAHPIADSIISSLTQSSLNSPTQWTFVYSFSSIGENLPFWSFLWSLLASHNNDAVFLLLDCSCPRFIVTVLADEDKSLSQEQRRRKTFLLDKMKVQFVWSSNAL